MDIFIGLVALIGFGAFTWGYAYGVSAFLTWAEKCVRDYRQRRKEAKLS